MYYDLYWSLLTSLHVDILHVDLHVCLPLAATVVFLATRLSHLVLAQVNLHLYLVVLRLAVVFVLVVVD